jgi:membrane-bound metal-dependent hydrolase YbcI (DUF457 family)
LDFVTHSLVGAGAARLVVRDPRLLPQLTLAALLGSLVMDGDSWLHLLGPNVYGRWHRVATHSLVGLGCCALFAAWVGWMVAGVPRWRRLGWFAADNLAPATDPPARAGFRAFAGVAALAAALHFAGDVITGFGNMLPLWPWSRWDASLLLVNSFDWVIFSTTLAWHVATRRWASGNRRRAMLLAAGWAVVVVGYLIARWALGLRGIW